MADMKNDWSYPVMETTLDKRLERPGVQRGMASEMTGVDGRSESGLKPFPGFRLAHRLIELQNQPHHSIASQVIDLKAIDFRIGSEHYGYGFVYRALRDPSESQVADVYIDYWNSVTQTWTYCHQITLGTDIEKQFDVAVAGRFIYCFIAGRTPALFYIDATRTKEYVAEADSYLDSVNPTVNYGTALTLRMQNTVEYALMRFNTSAEVGGIVESASLDITVSGNTLTASNTVTVKSVSDPTTTGQLWEEASTTWNLRKTAVNWGTAGGTVGSLSTINTVGVGFLGRLSFNVANLVIQSLLTPIQTFTNKVDFLLSVAGTGVLSLAARNQVNALIVPKLTVTYTNKVFINPVTMDGNSAVPGPGKQPKLKSPERGTSLGSFTTLPPLNSAAGQVVLVEQEPYANTANFPDTVSGLCSGGSYSDTFPAPPAVVIPGSPEAYVPAGPVCSAAPDGITSSGLLIQLVSPANKQTNVSATPRLDWNAYYEDGRALSVNMIYDVFLVQDGLDQVGDRVVAASLPYGTTHFDPASLWPTGKLPYGKKFLWKVLAKRHDCTDFFVMSMTGTFTTENRYQARKFVPGDYSFGYTMVDSKTGRKSAFSEVAQVRGEDFVISRQQNGVTVSSKRDQYIGIEVLYDSLKYDLMYVYRSVKIQDAGGTMIAGLPFLDAIVRLTDYQTCLNGTGRTFPPSQSLRHAMYFYELEDKQLVYQSPYVDRSVFDETMPYGGTAHFFQNTMMTSRVELPSVSTTDEARVDDANRGLGEMRWSSLMDSSPELFPPFNRYNPTVPSNEVICFAKAGGNLVGLSRDKVYHLRKSGPYIKVTEMHEGYGIVNPKAVDSVGSAAFFVTSHGLKSVDMQGQLDEIRILNNVFVREWDNDLTSIQVAHDPFMNALFIHNPVMEETYIMWFSTGKTTKLEDSNFDLISHGSWPVNWTGAQFGNDLCRRTFFLQNFQETRASGTGSDTFLGPAIFLVDQDDSKVISGGTASWNGARRITMMDFAGDSRFVASAAWASGAIPVTSATGTVVAAGAWRYAYVYLVNSVTNKQYVGRKAKVMYNTSTSVFVDSAVYPWVTNVVAGDLFVVSPVAFEWVGHPLGMSDEQGMLFSNADLFRMKVVSSVGSAFTDVSGPPMTDTVTASNPLNRFSGVLYSGTAEDPMAVALTKDTNGDLYASVEDDEGLVYAAFGSDASDGRYGAKGTSLSPGIRILCADLDYRLLGCIVRGSITSVERTTNIRGS